MTSLHLHPSRPSCSSKASPSLAATLMIVCCNSILTKIYPEIWALDEKDPFMPSEGDLDEKYPKTSGLDLVEGYHDAGDNVKLGLPMAFTITMMSWSIVKYGKQMAASGELSNAMEAVKWGIDYLIKAHPQPNVSYGEVFFAKGQEAVDTALKVDLVVLNTVVSGKWLDAVLKENVPRVLPKVLCWIHEMRVHYFIQFDVLHFPSVHSD